MQAPGKIKLTLYLVGFGGAALFTALIVRQGASQVVAALAAARWAVGAVVAYHLFAPIFLDSIAWGLLFPGRDRPLLRRLFWMRWISESVNALVPSATIGGDIVRARLAALCGAPLSVSTASVLVDITLNLFAVAGYTILGLILLVDASGQTHFVGPALLGTAIGLGACAGFYLAQRFGMFRFIAVMVTRMATAPAWQSLVQSGESLDQAIQAIYARRLGVAASLGASTLAFVGGGGEVWIGLHALGLHANLVHAIILHSTASAVRSAAFLVPAGLGVQEAGYVFVGNLLGIPGEAAFTLSLIARARELTLGIPGLISWQLVESRRLWRTRTNQTAP